jgi:hypothetical protein
LPFVVRFFSALRGPPSRFHFPARVAERLMEIMDAERELPPILQAALARYPGAREGWAKMPLSKFGSFVR